MIWSRTARKHSKRTKPFYCCPLQCFCFFLHAHGNLLHTFSFSDSHKTATYVLTVVSFMGEYLCISLHISVAYVATLCYSKLVHVKWKRSITNSLLLKRYSERLNIAVKPFGLVLSHTILYRTAWNSIPTYHLPFSCEWRASLAAASTGINLESLWRHQTYWEVLSSPMFSFLLHEYLIGVKRELK